MLPIVSYTCVNAANCQQPRTAGWLGVCTDQLRFQKQEEVGLESGGWAACQMSPAAAGCLDCLLVVGVDHVNHL